ncbi:MAG: hypothetical protein MJ144_03555 [Clostridia bacterium]|nr:hypothetical protein [Clostridia bacterium]
MEKRKTPVITIIFYILGILFLLVSVFMLISAIGYTKTYLASYGASFGDMWSNTLQYVIGQFMPYLGIGIVCLGIGKAIKEAGNAKAAQNPMADAAMEARAKEMAAAVEKLNGRIKYLADDIDTTREVLSIKIEEKEKRDAYRLAEMGRGLTAAMKALEVEDEPVKITVPTAPAGPEVPAEPEAPAVPAAPAGPRPQIFTVSRRMTMPACEEVKARPQIFTVSRRMTMPACAAVESLAAEEDQLSEININNHLTDTEMIFYKEEKAMKKYPQIFTMARKMVMPPCKK